MNHMAEKEEAADLETEEVAEIAAIEEVAVAIEEVVEEEGKWKDNRRPTTGNNNQSRGLKIFRIVYCDCSEQTNKRKLCYSQKDRSIEKCRKAV
jgi:hypothetical protein